MHKKYYIGFLFCITVGMCGPCKCGCGPNKRKSRPPTDGFTPPDYEISEIPPRDYEVTPLHEAVDQGDIKEAEHLLQDNANVNAKRPDGSTPLHLAAYQGNVEMAELLLKYNANVNAQEDGGRTPLHRAVSQGKVEVVQLLLKNGADVSAKDSYRETPLHKAARFGHATVVKALLDAGAKDIPNKNQKTAEIVARDWRHEEIANLIKNFKTPTP